MARPLADAPAASLASAAPERPADTFEEPTRVATLSHEELAKLGLLSPAPGAGQAAAPGVARAVAPPPPAARPPPVAPSSLPPPAVRPLAPARSAAPPGVELGELDFDAPLHAAGAASPPPRAAAPQASVAAPPPPAARPAPPEGGRTAVDEGLRRAASGTAPAPAAAVALSASQLPAAAPPARSGLDSADLFGGFGDLDLAGEPAAPAAGHTPGQSLLGDLDAPEERASTPSAADLENARALFDLPRREVIPPLPPPPAAQAPLELELALPPARMAPAQAPGAERARSAGGPEEAADRARFQPLRFTGTVLGLAGNLALALLLVLALAAVGRASLREGRLALGALAPGRLGELLAPSSGPLALHDVGNGLYDTRDGRAVFYVRGEVENRGGAPARVRVRAALYDGDQRVKSAEGLAGQEPGPEALYALTSADDAMALRIRLDAAARVLAPGERAPFTVVFFEYPPQLGDYRLELTPEPVAP
ncbi:MULTISPECIES: hypothetical protein [Myxococcaceae]|uniref:hypothetical protein n=1 Tax=Myxococcaceae TaxID=31 RepID=UPI00210260F1|nr:MULTISPECIES: hypothetical protein [Myxococcaceae]